MPSPYSLLPALVMVGPSIVADWITRYYARPRPDLPLSGRELGRQLLDRAGLHDVLVGAMVETSDQRFEGAYDGAGRFLGLSSGIDSEHSIAAYALVAHGVGQAIQARSGRLLFGERHRHALGYALLAFPVLLVAAFLVLAVAPSGARHAFLPLVIAFAGPGSIIGALLLLNMVSDLRADFGHALPMLAGFLEPADLRAARRVLVMRALSLAGFALLVVLASLVMLLVWLYGEP